MYLRGGINARGGVGVLSDSVKKKDRIVLGVREEVLSIDMMYMDIAGVEEMIDFVHHTAWKELLSRSIKSMKDWSSRANNLFIEYNFRLIGHLVVLSKDEINQLHGCGYKTRKEIYETYKSYGLIMNNWMPGDYYERRNYVFKD